MSDFIVNIDSKLDLSKAKSELDSFINSYKNSPVQIKVELDTKNINTSNLGKQIQGALNTSVNSVKFDGDTFYKQYFDKAKKDIDEAKKLQTNFNKSLSELDTKGIDKNALKAVNARKKAESEYQKEITKRQKLFSQLDATIASNKTLSWLKNNSKAAKDYGDVLTDLARKQRLATNADELKEYTKQVNAIKAEATALGKTGRSAFEEIGNSFKRIGQFAYTYGVIQQIPNKIGEMYQEVVKVDTAMTNLYKVTDETSAAYDKFLKGSGTTAKELGRDISSYITQTSEWAKLGYNMNSSSELAKISSIYSNVGEVDDKTAVSDLVTVMKAYNMQDTQAMNIVDMLNQLGNQYATSAADLGTGLSKMASTMSMSGVSLEKSLAVLTGGVEITQDADALGNAIKVSVLRMRGQKGTLESLGEYADDVESVSKMQTQILNMTKGAVNIMDSADPTAFRDWYDVMEDVAEVLPKLQETDQANLIETLFGKNRANQGQAILQAFQSGQIQKAYQTALNSEGSAIKEQERWLDSIEAKQQQMAAAFQELSTTAINSDFAKSMLDTGTGAIEIITEIIDKVGILQTLIGGFAIGKGITSFVKSFDKPACKAS